LDLWLETISHWPLNHVETMFDHENFSQRDYYPNIRRMLLGPWSPWDHAEAKR
jgi:hypothetical protein